VTGAKLEGTIPTEMFQLTSMQNWYDSDFVIVLICRRVNLCFHFVQQEFGRKFDFWNNLISTWAVDGFADPVRAN
jgi:hypothetical protein